MLLGIFAGLTTCALWGLTFVAARVVEPFTTLDLVVGRYTTFGLICLMLMIDPRFRPSGMAPRRLVLGFLMGLLGYVGYFASVATAVKLAGPALPPLIVGTMPVILALIANRRDRALRWRALALPLLLIAGGVAVTDVALLHGADFGARRTMLLGLLASLAALAIWVAYALVNAETMRAPDAPAPLRWTGIQGLGALAGSLCLLPFASFDLPAQLPVAVTLTFVAWAVLMGAFASWLATWAWVVAARRLPLTLSAQLIVAETVFGLFYGFLFERRLPLPSEALGASLQIAGVLWAISLFLQADRRIARSLAVEAAPSRSGG